MAIHNRKYLKARRQELRNNLTPAEAALWKHLKHSQLKGRKFRRQHSILNYIVDFYCPEERLIVELDGESHNNDGTRDGTNERELLLKSSGFKIIRFENEKVFTQLDFVLAAIEGCFKKDI